MFLFILEVIQSFFILTYICYDPDEPTRKLILALCYFSALFSTLTYKLICIVSIILMVEKQYVVCPEYALTFSTRNYTLSDLPFLLALFYAAIFFAFFLSVMAKVVCRTKKGCGKCGKALGGQVCELKKCCREYYHRRCLVREAGQAGFCPKCDTNRCESCRGLIRKVEGFWRYDKHSDKLYHVKCYKDIYEICAVCKKALGDDFQKCEKCEKLYHKGVCFQNDQCPNYNKCAACKQEIKQNETKCNVCKKVYHSGSCYDKNMCRTPIPQLPKQFIEFPRR